jgi:mRNA interferase MazF
VRRGDIVVVSAPDDDGKPRPAVVVQSDWLAGADSVLVALMTSALVDAPFYRLLIEPSAANGLAAPSQAMVDKIVALPRAECGRVVGRIGEASLIALNHMLSVMIGLAD